MKLTKAKKWLMVSVAVAVLVVVLLLVFSFSFRVLSGEYAFTKTFEEVVPGLDEEKVLALLGNPDEKGTEFRLGQYKGFEEKYQRASASNAKYYWVWFRGPDIVYAVGFDEQHKVVVAESGGT